QAEHWLRVRPGTDAALALGLAHLLLQQGRFDEGFVRAWTNAPLLVREADGLFLRESDIRSDGRADVFMAWDERLGQAVSYERSRDYSGEPGLGLALRGEYVVSGIECKPAFHHFHDACKAYTPERVASLTWVSEADIRAAAETIMAARKISYHAWTGVGQHSNASQTERAIATLYALTGCFDAEGGNVVYNRQPVNRVNSIDLLPAAQRGKALGLASRPLGPPASGWITARDLYDAVI